MSINIKNSHSMNWPVVLNIQNLIQKIYHLAGKLPYIGILIFPVVSLDRPAYRLLDKTSILPLY